MTMRSHVSEEPDSPVFCRRVAVADRSDAAELHRLGVVAGRRGDFAESARLLSRALELRPGDAEIHNDLGVTLEQSGELGRAAACYRAALRLRPNFHQVWNNLANALLHNGDAAGALEACERAIGLEPKYGPAHNTRGAALLDLGRVAEALEEYRRAIALRPDHAEAHANYGMALLLSGDFENGWKEYEWRLKLPVRPLKRSGPLWEGSDPFGRTLLLWGEGGLGNVIQFARYASAMAEVGVRVVLECQRELVPLLKTVPGVWKCIAHGEEAKECDGHCPLASLPGVLGTRLATVPANVPYVRAEPQRIERWGDIVRRGGAETRGRGDKTKLVGVCWKGSQKVVQLRGRSFDPMLLLPIAKLPGVRLINLQHGEEPPGDLPMVTLPGLGPQEMRLEDVAAVMQHLDLVITCDTSIAHLEGALGVPAWVALRHSSDWRWMMDREDSPWYPSMRLFRQERPNEWSPLFARMASAIGDARPCHKIATIK